MHWLVGSSPCSEIRTRISSPTSSGVGARNLESHMGVIALGRYLISVTKTPQIDDDLTKTRFKKIPIGVKSPPGFGVLELDETRNVS